MNITIKDQVFAVLWHADRIPVIRVAPTIVDRTSPMPLCLKQGREKPLRHTGEQQTEDKSMNQYAKAGGL